MKDSKSQPTELKEFLGFAFLIGILFAVLFQLQWQLHSLFNKTFQDMKFADKCAYLTRIQGCIHAILVAIPTFIGMFYLCDNPSETIFTDMQCLNTPKIFHRYTATITVGYLTLDLLIIVFLCRDFSPLGWQFIAHHVAGTTAFAATLFLEQNFLLTVCIVNQFSEISTFFLNVRNMLYTHKA